MIDWDDAFDNSGYVAGSDTLGAEWAQKAEAIRATFTAQGRAQLDLRYGSGQREVFDLFSPDAPAKGHAIFVHGGFWHLLDKSYWSHYAKGILDNCWAVAIPSYPLAPHARISEITDALRRAVTEVAEITDGPIALVGHSAGGHLVTRMACEGVLPEPIRNRITRVTSISGIYHLTPLLATGMNTTLGLTESEAEAESPVLLDPAGAIPITFWVGDQERPEFLRQTRMAAERWGAKAARIHSVFEPGTHHFNVLDTLQQQSGALTREVLR